MTAKLTLLSTALLLGSATAASAQSSDAKRPILVSQVSNASLELTRDCIGETSSSRAVRACTRLLRDHLMPDESEAHALAHRARHHLALGRQDRAADDFARALELAPDMALTASR